MSCTSHTARSSDVKVPLAARAPSLEFFVDVREAALAGVHDGPNLRVGEEFRAVSGSEVPLCFQFRRVVRSGQ